MIKPRGEPHIGVEICFRMVGFPPVCWVTHSPSENALSQEGAFFGCYICILQEWILRKMISASMHLNLAELINSCNFAKWHGNGWSSLFNTFMCESCEFRFDYGRVFSHLWKCTNISLGASQETFARGGGRRCGNVAQCLRAVNAYDPTEWLWLLDWCGWWWWCESMRLCLFVLLSFLLLLTLAVGCWLVAVCFLMLIFFLMWVHNTNQKNLCIGHGAANV